jgi:hypothetical protein
VPNNIFQVLLKEIKGIPTINYLIKRPKPENIIKNIVQVEIAITLEDSSVKLLSQNGLNMIENQL